MRHLPQVAQDDARRVARVGQRQDQRLSLRHRRLRDGAPRIPRLMLAQLVQHDQVAREPTASATVRSLDLVPGARGELKGLLAVDLDHAPQQLRQLLVVLYEIDGALPHLFGGLKILRSAEHQRPTPDDHEPQRQDLREGALAVLPGHEHDHRAEPQAAILQQLKHVDQQPPLPREQVNADGLGKVDDVETERRLPSQRAQWRGENPGRLTAQALRPCGGASRLALGGCRACCHRSPPASSLPASRGRQESGPATRRT